MTRRTASVKYTRKKECSQAVVPEGFQKPFRTSRFKGGKK